MEIPKFDETFLPILKIIKTTYEIKQVDEDFFDEQ